MVVDGGFFMSEMTWKGAEMSFACDFHKKTDFFCRVKKKITTKQSYSANSLEKIAIFKYDTPFVTFSQYK